MNKDVEFFGGDYLSIPDDGHFCFPEGEVMIECGVDRNGIFYIINDDDRGERMKRIQIIEHLIEEENKRIERRIERIKTRSKQRIEKIRQLFHDED